VAQVLEGEGLGFDFLTTKYPKYAKNGKTFNAKAQRREGARSRNEIGSWTDAHHLVTRTRISQIFFASLRLGVFALNPSKIAKRARLELEARTGKKVVTGENYLPPASAKKIRDVIM
jgi:hypothetical protein